MGVLPNSAVLRYIENGWRVIPIVAGKKKCWIDGWPDLVITADEVPRYFGQGENVGVILGRRSNNLVDSDLDCTEAIELADIYLPSTESMFGRDSKPCSHRLYTCPGAVFAAFGDPIDSTTLLELRADGSTGGAHITMFPGSINPSGETVEWHIGDAATPPREVAASLLHQAAVWLAIACLIKRYVSDTTAETPSSDFPKQLWEFDPVLGAAAFKWLGLPNPDEARARPVRPRKDWSRRELDLDEVVRAIPNNFDFWGWNRIGMGIWSASDGSDLGFAVFDRFSAQNQKYQAAAVRERWQNYNHGRPSRIGLGTLVYYARQAGWRPGRTGR